MSMGRMKSDFYFIPNVEFQFHVIEDLYEMKSQVLHENI